MRILIYMDPWIVAGEPLVGKSWPCIYEEFIKSTSIAGHSFHVFVGDSNYNHPAIKDIKRTPKVRVSQISQKELKCIFANYIDAHKKEYTDSCSPEEIFGMTELIQAKLGGFKPDIMFYFGGAGSPVLKQLFPNAPLICQEASTLNCRALFPTAWYLDVCGMNNKSFLSVFYKEILNIQVDSATKNNFLKNLRQACIDPVSRSNPLTRKILDPDRKFKYIVFLPLESSMHYNFFNHSDFVTQLDLIIYILDRLDPDIGLVVKEHMSHGKRNTLRRNAIDYLRCKYNNFIFIDNLKESVLGAYFILDLSDALITVSSTMGMQCLLWEKPFFVIGDMYIKHYSNGSKIEEIKNILEREYKDKDDVLYHLLNNYYVPHSKFLDPEWMEKFMKRAMKNHKNINFDFYEPIDTHEDMLSFYANKSIGSLLRFKTCSILDKAGVYFPLVYAGSRLISKICGFYKRTRKHSLGV